MYFLICGAIKMRPSVAFVAILYPMPMVSMVMQLMKLYHNFTNLFASLTMHTFPRLSGL